MLTGVQQSPTAMLQWVPRGTGVPAAEMQLLLATADSAFLLAIVS